MTVKDIFINLTKTTMPAGNEHLAEKYLPKGWKKDSHGNYYIKIGNPTVMFTSHLDTADNGQPKEVTHVIKGNRIETNGKTILGADDKAGTAVMIKMIENNVTGLYYFFLSEERGCVGSRALNTYLNTHKDDELYKNLTKIISLDRRDDYSVITFQVGERCCSDEFAEELARRLNEAGGFKYRKDPTGSVTDSHQLADKFSECTNLSVGYDAQHTTRESQDIDFLTKLADACCKIDWETLPVKRDFTKTEYAYSNYNRRSSTNTRYYGNDWNETDRWWENGDNKTHTQAGTIPRNAEFVTDYLGNKLKVADAIWCPYDKAWCDKKEAIWVDYIGFYTTPDFDPSKVKKNTEIDGLVPAEIEDIKVGLTFYNKDGEIFGKVVEIDDEDLVHIESENNSMFICPKNRLMSYGFNKKVEQNTGSKKLTSNDLKDGLKVYHPIFGAGKIIGIKPDKLIVKILFDNKGEKDIRVDVADMKF